jgi:hypothetical protein
MMSLAIPTQECMVQPVIEGDGEEEVNVTMYEGEIHGGANNGLLLAGHQLEVGNLLQLGDDELAMHVIDLHLKGVDLHIIFLKKKLEGGNFYNKQKV